jgi:putative phosphoribosyl transferase
MTQPLFRDRSDAGRALAVALGHDAGPDALVVGLVRGGVVVAAEVAARLAAPLDALAVRKIRHPHQPEYALGAVAPGAGGVYVRGSDGLTNDEVAHAVAAAVRSAHRLDDTLHAAHRQLSRRGRTVVLVDDGLATGATMIAAARWARAGRPAATIAAVPVAARQSVDAVSREVDRLVCPHVLDDLYAVGIWYADFDEVSDDDVLRLLEEVPV